MTTIRGVMRRTWPMLVFAAAIIAALLVLGCSDDPRVSGLSAATCTDADFAAGLCGGTLPPPPPPAPPPPPPPGAQACGYPDGLAAFIAECAPCHASRDGFDLAYFSYFDSTIVRRALGHVCQEAADQIAAYIKTIQSPHVPEMMLLWQPGGSKLATDAAFATELFGQDGWPSTWTKAQLLARDPLNIRIAVALLPWSTEVTGNGATLEWMPDTSLATEVLSYNGGAASAAVAAYYANRTVANLNAVITTVETAAFGIGWCNFNSAAKHFVKCFEHRRWTSNLSADFKLRSGNPNAFVSTTVYMGWWEVGEAARRSRGYPGAVPDQLQNQLRWEYLGWMFDPAHVPAIYTVQAFGTIGLRRHTTWIALRSLVARPAWCQEVNPGVCDEDANVHQDFRVFALNSLPGTAWSNNPADDALTWMQERINAGDRPTSAADRQIAITQINQGMSALTAKVTAAEKSALQVKANAVIAGLQ